MTLMGNPVERIVIREPYLKVGCMLGEGPIYDEEIATLHFVDIVEQKVYHLDMNTLQLVVERFDESVTCLAIRRNRQGLACATASGIALIERGELHYLARPIREEDRAHTRFNDGACDSKGRFFVGTVHSRDKEGIPGQLYMFDPKDGSCRVVDPGPFTDSNGLGWSLDEKTMYFTDSGNNIIYAYDYDDGHISNRRTYVDTGFLASGLAEPSSPDGLCMDDQGGIWSARWGGSCVARFSREGNMDVRVDLPTVYRVTACCFGGPKNDELFITTAHCAVLGGNEEQQKEYPDSGHLFKVDFSGKYRGGRWRYNFTL